MSEMNREAEILYLKTILELEVARDMILKTAQSEKRRIDTRISIVHKKMEDETIKPYNYYSPEEEPEFTPSFGYITLICAVILYVFGIAYLINPFTGGLPHVSSSNVILYDVLFGFSIMFGGFIFSIKPLDEWRQYSLKKKEWRIHSSQRYIREQNKKIMLINEKLQITNKEKRDKRIRELNKLELMWDQRNKYLQNEQKTVEGILRDFYGMNLIPDPYRPEHYGNLKAIAYIYNWMSTSQDSLSMTLLHAHIEDGIKRIEKKLDDLLYEVRKSIELTRQMEERASKTYIQNQEMIRSLQNTERNTKIAAEYAQLASNYSRANAYFSLATYLKKS